MKTFEINWYAIECSALTAIRREWSLLRVLDTYEEGYETPVSGDDLHKA